MCTTSTFNFPIVPSISYSNCPRIFLQSFLCCNLYTSLVLFVFRSFILLLSDGFPSRHLYMFCSIKLHPESLLDVYIVDLCFGFTSWYSPCQYSSWLILKQVLAITWSLSPLEAFSSAFIRQPSPNLSTFHHHTRCLLWHSISP